MPKDPLKDMMDDRSDMTPKKGYNLVGLDDFEEPGEQLYLIGHFKTRAAAEAAKKKHEETRVNNDDKLFIYGPND